MHPKHAGWAMLLVLAACNRSPQPPSRDSVAAPVPAPATVAAPVDLADVSERDPHYLVGISFPPELKRYPSLAAVVKRDADAVHADFLRQVAANKDEQGSGLFDLSLMYTMVAQSPRIVAVAAEGTSFVGGAHGAPLLERYVWLLPENRRLTAAELVPDPAGWGPISDYVREQLLATQRQRFADDAKAGTGVNEAGGDEAGGAGLREQLHDATETIAQGTEPKAVDFANFEPVLGPDGKIAALRFVFPPYQVGPYSDGTQSVDVPAEVLLPHVAAADRALFAGG
jgi:hypothetical protein